MAADTHPTQIESMGRLWNRLPSLWRSLIPAFGGLFLVLMPATALISSRFYAVTDDNLRAEHQRILSDIGSAFDKLISDNSQFLSDLANTDTVKACAPTGCTDQAQAIFDPELDAKMRSADYLEIGFINVQGQETARVIRGSGGVINSPGDSPLFSTDPALLLNVGADQPYVFPITRDTRVALSESYQQPTLRLAVPVFTGDQRQGYVTAVINLDNFFIQHFVYSDQQETFLLDTDKCLLATSDNTRRAELYKTWAGSADKTCYPDLQLQDWDITLQPYRDSIVSTKVIHDALSTSNQTWTIVIQQPMSLAYAQANGLRTLLIAAHLTTIVIVTLLMLGTDRAMRRLQHADEYRKMTHARDIHFNPYVVGAPIEDRRRFFGRTGSMAEIIGIGVMGGEHVLVEGDRRIGKTSLLHQVEMRLCERRISDPHYWYWPVAISLQGIPADDFYVTVMDHILRDVPDHASQTDLAYDRNDEHYTVRDFQEDIGKLLKLPNPAGQQTHLILMLDNIHLWFAGTPGYDAAFITTFQHLLTSIEHQVKIIATGTHLPADAFDRRFVDVRLGPLEPTEAERLVHEPVAEYYTYSDEATASILANSDLLPMELQRLARHAVTIMLEQDAPVITLDHAERAFQRAISNWEPTFRLLWNGGTDKDGKAVERLTDEQRALLLDIAARDVPLPKDTTIPVDDIAYTDSRGNCRLTAVFKAWLRRG